MHMFFVLEGRKTRPVTNFLEVGMSDPNRQIALTTIGPFEISTVFVGIDMSHSCIDHEPLLFETMIFDNRGPITKRRYSTYDEAEKGHQQIVDRVFRYQHHNANEIARILTDLPAVIE